MMRATVTDDHDDYDDDEDEDDDARADMLAELEELAELGRPTPAIRWNVEREKTFCYGRAKQGLSNRS
jgi:hypothetical protein